MSGMWLGVPPKNKHQRNKCSKDTWPDSGTHL